MSKVLFSRKHIIISLIMAIVVLILGLTFWATLIQPKVKKVGELKKQLVTLTTDIQSEQTKLQELQDLPSLLETTMVTAAPKIPNGMSFVEYFQGLAQNTSVSLQHMTFNDQSIFPRVTEGDLGAESQLRDLAMNFDVVGDTEANLMTFIEKLENDSRFTKIVKVAYRHNPDSVGEGSYSHSATINLSMYYLSNFETGKALATEEVKK